MYDVVISEAGPSESQCAEVVAKAGYNFSFKKIDLIR